MEKLRRLLREPGFPLLLVFGSLFLFGWPFLAVPETGSALASFIGLFATWGIFILILFLMWQG